MGEWLLDEWDFAVGNDMGCLGKAVRVTLPHTWNTREQLQNWHGRGWYRTKLPPCEEGEKRTFVYFRGVYRDAEVYVEDRPVLKHEGSAYTPFGGEITRWLEGDGRGVLTVSADSRFSRSALPYDQSFDWADDGGIFRPVSCRRTGDGAILGCRIDTWPVIAPGSGKQRTAEAFLRAEAETDAPEGYRLEWKLEDGAGQTVRMGRADASPSVKLSERLESVSLWHFDSPALYTLRLTLKDAQDVPSDERSWRIGFREMKTAGERWLFNGEPVRLPGMEWMPGSNPDHGAAEPWGSQEKMLRLLRDSNSVLTRFHWQQDDRVLDWCDEHGLLVQEEIPFWGKQPEGDPEALWPVAKRQLREMIEAHRHHPCVVAWGVGNELSGQTKAVRRYVRRAVAEAGRLDGTRLVNYVTNTAWDCPFDDASCEGDVLMINDYIGTWHRGLEEETAWRSVLDAHPGRVLVPSEFGLCEPAFAGGDAERERIFLEKLDFYRKIDAIGGTVYFCLNDYRTHMGEDGAGRLRRRVHGSADWKGEPKPSYFTVKREYAPLTLERCDGGIRVRVRHDIPCYTAQGYVLTDGIRSVTIPDLTPLGREEWLCTFPLDPEKARILRPAGGTI